MHQESQRLLLQGWDGRSKTESSEFACKGRIQRSSHAVRVAVRVVHVHRGDFTSPCCRPRITRRIVSPWSQLANSAEGICLEVCSIFALPPDRKLTSVSARRLRLCWCRQGYPFARRRRQQNFAAQFTSATPWMWTRPLRTTGVQHQQAPHPNTSSAHGARLSGRG